MKRVLIFTYYWPPSGGAGVQRWLKFSKFLPEYGWEPIVITVDPKKATYPVLDNSLQNEVGDNVRVIRTDSQEWFSLYKKLTGSGNVPYAGFANESQKTSFMQKAARFFRGNFFLPDPRKGWNKYALKAAASLINDTSIDCIVTTGPPHSTQLIGLKLRKKYNIPWLADFRDPWTDIYYDHQFFPTLPAKRINLGYERKVLIRSDLVLTVSKGLKEIFLGKQYFKTNKVKVIHNGFDEEDFQFEVSPEKNHFIISYVGTLSDIYPIDSFIKAFLDLLKKFPAFKLRFIGSVSSNQHAKLKEIPDNSIEFIEYVEHKKAVEYMKLSDVLLLVIPEHSSGKGILTGKIFEYLAAGCSILGIGPPDGDSGLILKETGAGMMLLSNNQEEMITCLTRFYDESKTHSSKDNKHNYLQFSRKILTGELAKIMNSLSR